MTNCKYPGQDYYLCPNSKYKRSDNLHLISSHGCKFSKEDYYSGELLCMADKYKCTGVALKSDLNTQKTNGEM